MGQESARQADERTQTVVRQAARGVFEIFAAVGRVPEPWQAVAGALLVARPAADQVEAAVELVLDVLAARVAGLAQLPLEREAIERARVTHTTFAEAMMRHGWSDQTLFHGLRAVVRASGELA